jgi:DNA-binding NarL/FixJ family response regulator
VAVVAVNLPDESGLRLVRRLHCEHPNLAILVYTGIEDVATLAEALESGARGFVLKPGGILQLVQALRLVAGGKRYVDPAIRALLDAEGDRRPLVLTRRERDVFDLLAEGLTGEEIATRLTVSAETVRTHIRNGMEKLHAHTRTGAVVQALRTHEPVRLKSARVMALEHGGIVERQGRSSGDEVQGMSGACIRTCWLS